MEMKTTRSLFTYEPLPDEEWLTNYRKKQQENQKLERELKKRLENHVLVRVVSFAALYAYIRVPHLSCLCAFMHVFVGFLPLQVSSIEGCFDRRSFRSTKVDSLEDKSQFDRGL